MEQDEAAFLDQILDKLKTVTGPASRVVSEW